MDVQRMNELIAIQRETENDFLSRPGVTGVDVGYKIVDGQKTDELAIRVYVAKKKSVRSVPKAERIPKEIQNAATDVIERTFVLHPAMMAVADLQVRANTTRYAPIRGGISLGPCRALNGFVFVGTLGCMVTDNTTGDPMMLTNYHVAAVDPSWNAGDNMAQPSLVDGGHCPNDVVGTLQRAQVDENVDAAVVQYTGDRGHDCEIEEIGAINGTAVAVTDMAVRKRGRTTGLTFGAVDSISLTVNVDYDGIGTVTLRNQIGIEVDTARSVMFGTNGDSGSVVVDDDNNVVGLYYAGSEDGTFGVANHIDAVLRAMNVSICTQPKSLLKDIADDHPPVGEVPEIIKQLKDDKDGQKEWKEKEWKEKEWKEGKEKELKEWKEKEKDIFENPIDWTPLPFRSNQAPPLAPRSGEAQTGSPQAISASSTTTSLTSPECIDFTMSSPSLGPNPRQAGSMTLEVFGYQGGSHTHTRIDDWGGFKGLNCGHRLEINFSRPCTVVEVTLVHFVMPARVTGINTDGSSVGPVSMTVGQMTPESLVLRGSLSSLIIEAPQNETLLQQICCHAVGIQKPLISEKPEFLEGKLWKDLKDKEFFEGPAFSWPSSAPQMGTSSTSVSSSSGDVAQRLARLEAALSQLTHFISPSLRPDLSKGALQRESDK